MENIFSDYTEPGKGDLTYEMEYILCGKDTDKKNLESSIERLMRMREAANVAHIIADREKLNQTLMIATSLAGFSGNPGSCQDCSNWCGGSVGICGKYT